MQDLLKGTELVKKVDGTSQDLKSTGSRETKILLWATETDISILIDNKLHKKPVNKQQLLYLAQMFLDKAINCDFYKEFSYTKNDFKD